MVRIASGARKLNKDRANGVGYNVLKAAAGENPWEPPMRRTKSWPYVEKVDPFLFRNSQRSLWSFYKHGITSSFMDTWLTCREQARLHYVEGWQSRTVPLALEFGTCIHWIFEHFVYTPDGMARMRAYLSKEGWLLLLQKWANWAVGQYEKHWLLQVESPTRSQLEQQVHVYGLAQAILPFYIKRWDGDFNGGDYTFTNDSVHPVKWVSLEELFCVPYTYSDGLQVPVRGRRDGIFLDARNDEWIFDTKCRSVIKDDEILDTMPFDFQQMLYLWVRYEQGFDPKGSIVNIPRRPGHRKGKHETLANLHGRVAAEVSKPKNFDHYFLRFQMAITRDEVYHWKATRLDPIMEDLRGWWEGRHPHYPTDKNLTTKYGPVQMYIPIVKGEFHNCYKRSVPFPELLEVAA